MATQIKRTLAFDLAPGAEVTLVHGLRDGANNPVIPDHIEIPSPALEVVSTTSTSIVVRNSGPTQLAGAILVEWWHTIERDFGDAANLDLTVKPYIQVGAEVANSPPQPPFPVPPFAIIIYARLTGSDATGNGTLANPYRTFQRAIRDVPSFIPPGVRYIVDITGIGVETLPDDFVLPSWKSSYATSAYDHDNPYFYGIAAVTIRANPVLATLGAGPNIIPVAGTVITPDPVTGLITITVPGAGWGVNALVGLFVIGDIQVGVPFSNHDKSPIISNTATTITIAHDAGPPVFGVQLPARIMDLSATLEGKASDIDGAFAFGNAAIDASNQDSLCLQGLRIRPTDGLSRGIRFGGGTGFPDLCHIVNGAYYGFDNDKFQFTSCIIDGGYLNMNLLFSLFTRYLGGPVGLTWFTHYLQCFGGSSFEGVNPVGAYTFAIIIGALIKDAPSDAFGFVPTPSAILIGAEINDSVGDAVVSDRGNNYELSAVVGANPLGGRGIVVNNGAQVLADASVTVTGSAPGVNDIEVGSLGPAAYPAPGTNVPDFAGAAATGARLFYGV